MSATNPQRPTIIPSNYPQRRFRPLDTLASDSHAEYSKEIAKQVAGYETRPDVVITEQLVRVVKRPMNPRDYRFTDRAVPRRPDVVGASVATAARVAVSLDKRPEMTR